jgi:hypothetical protein
LILRQFLTFSGVGLVAAVAHFGVLIALVEGGGIVPVFAHSGDFSPAPEFPMFSTGATHSEATVRTVRRLRDFLQSPSADSF